MPFLLLCELSKWACQSLGREKVQKCHKAYRSVNGHDSLFDPCLLSLPPPPQEPSTSHHSKRACLLPHALSESCKFSPQWLQIQERWEEFRVRSWWQSGSKSPSLKVRTDMLWSLHRLGPRPSFQLGELWSSWPSPEAADTSSPLLPVFRCSLPTVSQGPPCLPFLQVETPLHAFSSLSPSSTFSWKPFPVGQRQEVVESLTANLVFLPLILSCALVCSRVVSPTCLPKPSGGGRVDFTLFYAPNMGYSMTLQNPNICLKINPCFTLHLS